MRLVYEYANLYRTGVLDALSGAINNSVTSIVVKDASKFYVAAVFSVDSEHIRVTAVTLATNTLTVSRGYDSTTAASHADLAVTTILGVALTEIGTPVPTPDYFPTEKRNMGAQIGIVEGNWYAQAGGDASCSVGVSAKGYGRGEFGAPVTLYAATLPGQSMDHVFYGIPSVSGSTSKQIIGASPAATGRFFAQFFKPATNFSAATGVSLGMLDPKLLLGVQRTAGAPFTAGVLVLERLSIYSPTPW